MRTMHSREHPKAVGACALLSYHQPQVDTLLGVDGQEEFAIYLACVGKPKSD